jgi:hypothetical protein
VKVDRLLSIRIVAEVAKGAAIRVGTIVSRTEEEVNRVRQVIVMDQVLDDGSLESLPGLRLPSQHAIVRNRLVKIEVALALAEGHKEDIRTRPVGNLDDPQNAPPTGSPREPCVWGEDVVDLFA